MRLSHPRKPVELYKKKTGRAATPEGEVKRARSISATKRHLISTNPEFRDMLVQGARTMTITRMSNPETLVVWRNKLRENRLKQVLPRKDTKIEVRLQEALASRGIPFETHKPIYGQPDIFIEPNICIFADGDYWHNLPKRKALDKVVNATLESMGYKVLRFWEHEIYDSLDWCISEISSLT